MRSTPDVAALGDNYTGFSIFVNGKLCENVGGTSLASPIIAGTIAMLISQYMINQNITKRVNININDLHNVIYHDAADFIDVVNDSTYQQKSGWNNIYSSTTQKGYDLVCGMGEIIFDKIIKNLNFVVSE